MAQQILNDPERYFGGDAQPYLDWIQENDIAERYGASTYIPAAAAAGDDGSDGVAIHWQVVVNNNNNNNNNSNQQELHLAVAARAEGGWLAFGISQAGGMLGADMVYFETAAPDQLTDAHVVETRSPIPDDNCGQDWILVDSDTTRPGFLMWQGRRPLQTGDAQDFDITVVDKNQAIPGHRVIAAWGSDNDRIGYHGNHVARGTLRFHATAQDLDDFSAVMEAQATASFVVQATNHTIEPVDTAYVDFCITKADILSQGVPDTDLHVIGFEPIVTPGNEKYVHHFVVTASSNEADDACTDRDGFTELAYLWAPGEQALALPDFLGGPLFGSGFSSYNLEIHYNNPYKDLENIDYSGVRFYVSEQLREQELGLLQVGDPFVLLRGQPIGNGLSRHTLTCPGSCSAFVLDEPVTVLRELLHMHESGVRMTNEQIRGDEKVREGVIEVWEYDQQSNALVTQEPFEIQPGDSFRTTCYFRDDSDATFGLSSQQEMCIAFLAYYPRKMVLNRFPWFCATGVSSFEVCNAEYESSLLDSDEALGRNFGQVSSLSRDCPQPEQPEATSAPRTSSQGPDSPSGAQRDLVTFALMLAWASLLCL